MKIIKLQSENFKKIKAIEITPTTNEIIISGKNGQGKTSILDSIFVALCGKQKELSKPIRDGESTATITVELDKYWVTRIFTQGSTRLEVISKDGEIMASPQALLDSIVGELSFDPLAFASLKEKEQRALLLKLINCDIDVIDKDYVDIYEKRRGIGQDLLLYPEVTAHDEALAKECLAQPMISASELVRQLSEAKEKEAQSIRFGLKYRALKEEIESLKLLLKQKEEELTSFPQLISFTFDFEALQKQIDSIEHNQKVRNVSEQLLIDVKKRQTINERYQKYTDELDALKDKKNKLLSGAKMPVPGLNVSDYGITFNTIPFPQLSTSEKLKISMAIAMAMNPELRVIRISDGSLLDDDNMKIIREMADSGDFQVWIERVDSSGKVGFYIEEGEIKSSNL